MYYLAWLTLFLPAPAFQAKLAPFLLFPSKQKPSKAQKRKEKLAAKDAEREARIAAELEALGTTERQAEEEALKAVLAPLGLAIKEIRVSLLEAMGTSFGGLILETCFRSSLGGLEVRDSAC